MSLTFNGTHKCIIDIIISEVVPLFLRQFQRISLRYNIEFIFGNSKTKRTFLDIPSPFVDNFMSIYGNLSINSSPFSTSISRKVNSQGLKGWKLLAIEWCANKWKSLAWNLHKIFCQILANSMTIGVSQAKKGFFK